MAGSPGFKIYDDEKVYQAATKDGTLAAALIGAAGFGGWTVKFGGRIVWKEGSEEFSASDSVDDTAAKIYERIDEHHRQRMARLG
jgi:hypothetical protein